MSHHVTFRNVLNKDGIAADESRKALPDILRKSCTGARGARIVTILKDGNALGGHVTCDLDGLIQIAALDTSTAPETALPEEVVDVAVCGIVRDHVDTIVRAREAIVNLGMHPVPAVADARLRRLLPAASAVVLTIGCAGTLLNGLHVEFSAAVFIVRNALTLSDNRSSDFCLLTATRPCEEFLVDCGTRRCTPIDDPLAGTVDGGEALPTRTSNVILTIAVQTLWIATRADLDVDTNALDKVVVCVSWESFASVAFGGVTELG